MLGQTGALTLQGPHTYSLWELLKSELTYLLTYMQKIFVNILLKSNSEN